jgi:outer membrane protein OmpA-like peptidoglycan-associated protein
MKRFLSSTLLVALAATVGFVACGSGPVRQNAKQAPLPDAGGDLTYNPKLPGPGDFDDRYISLDLGDTAKTCAIPTTRFRFDSTEMQPDERAQLHALASCLQKPELIKTEIRLVGRADATGTAQYNEELSSKRGERVKKILVEEGVAAARISTTKRGERDAVGGNSVASPASPGYDRRVDIILDGDHAPKKAPETHGDSPTNPGPH